MNRKDFFKKLGLGAIVAFTAPKLLSEDLSSSGISNNCFSSSRHDGMTDTFKDGNWYSRTYLTNNCRLDEHHYTEYPFTFKEAVKEADWQLIKAMNEEMWRMKL